MKLLLRLSLVAAAALVVGFAAPGRAAAKAPCWKVLINDWYDGRIDKTYDPQCYRDAIKHLPPDVEVYSNAKDDLKRALQNVLAGKPPNQGVGGGGSSSGTGKPTKTATSANPGKGGADTIGRDTTAGGPANNAIRGLGPKNADSVPIPLLVLGGLALLLVAAGGAGLIAKRLQTRRGAS